MSLSSVLLKPKMLIFMYVIYAFHLLNCSELEYLAGDPREPSQQLLGTYKMTLYDLTSKAQQ